MIPEVISPVDLKTKTVMLWDSGLFLSWAELLAPHFKKVQYYMPYQRAFPTSNEREIGAELPGVERVYDDPMQAAMAADLIIFFDVNLRSYQQALRDAGKRVWGSGDGDHLELDRAETKELLTELGLDVGPWKQLESMDELKKYLQKNENKYIKVSETRGDTESFHHQDWDLSEAKFQMLEHKFGPLGRNMEIIVEDPIEPAIELALDIHAIDDQYPENVMLGLEIKDAGYIMAVIPYEEAPAGLRKVYDTLRPVLKDMGYRNFVSFESRLHDDGRCFLDDPCCRAPSPPNELYQVAVSNWPEIFWHGAEGRMVQPIYACKYGVELIVHSLFAQTDYECIKYPPAVEPFVKLRNYTMQDGKHYVIPQSDKLIEIAAISGIGDEPMEAIKSVLAHSKKVQGFDIDVMTTTIPRAIQEVRRACRKHGFRFGKSPLPSLADVCEEVFK